MMLGHVQKVRPGGRKHVSVARAFQLTKSESIRRRVVVWKLRESLVPHPRSPRFSSTCARVDRGFVSGISSKNVRCDFLSLSQPQTSAGSSNTTASMALIAESISFRLIELLACTPPKNNTTTTISRRRRGWHNRCLNGAWWQWTAAKGGDGVSGDGPKPKSKKRGAHLFCLQRCPPHCRFHGIIHACACR